MSSFTITVIANGLELESQQLADSFASAMSLAVARFKARATDGATVAMVHDEMGRRLFEFPSSEDNK